jgi:hypothetical protein
VNTRAQALVLPEPGRILVPELLAPAMEPESEPARTSEVPLEELPL